MREGAMVSEDKPSGYRIYAEDGLPDSVISYLEGREFPISKSAFLIAVMLCALLLCMAAPFLGYIIFHIYYLDLLAMMLWDGKSALLVRGGMFAFAFIMMFAGICFSAWGALILTSWVKGSAEFFAAWTLDEGISGQYAGLNRSLNRVGLRRTSKRFAHDPPSYLRAFAWRMAGMWGQAGLWLTCVALIFLYLDLNYFSVVTRTAVHHSPYFSVILVHHDLNDVKHVEVGCSYDTDDEDLHPYYSLVLPDEVRFNLADMKPAKGTLIAVLERFDQQFTNRNVEIRRARYEDGKHSGRPIADPACRINLIKLHGRADGIRWVKLLRLDTEIP